MGSALIGLAGALVGALAALIGSTLSERRQSRNEERRWRRDQLATAYEQTLRYLIRAANRRSELDPKIGQGVLKKEHHREWFDDVAEAQYWLLTLTSRCGAAYIDPLLGAARRLDHEVQDLGGAHNNVWATLRRTWYIVLECSRDEMGNGSLTPSGAPKTAREAFEAAAKATCRPTPP